VIVSEARAGVRRWASGARERYVAMFTVFVSLGLLAQPSVHAQPSPTADAAAAQQAVETLRDLPTPLPNVGNGTHPLGQPAPIPPSEVTRDASYRELYRLGPAGITALARAYTDPDVRLRRNVALAFLVLSWGLWPGLEKADVGDALPELTAALTDKDPHVRGWSAQAIGMIGAEAQSAVPALIRLLQSANEGSRNSACLGLRGIGPAASGALPALRRALSDRSTHVREFAARAIQSIEG
jgi:hypothetical protein